MRTDVFNNPAVESLRAMALYLIPRLRWRHHGIGVLQGYVTEDVEPEVRLHIWSPALVKPGIQESGDIHDHRFNLRSHVLAGEVQHAEYVVEEDAGGSHTAFFCTHARAAADANYHGPIRPTEVRYTVKDVLPFTVRSGETYTFPAGLFHRSPVNGFGISCIEKTAQSSAQARILHPWDLSPVMAFGHSTDGDVIDQVLAEATRRLKDPDHAR